MSRLPPSGPYQVGQPSENLLTLSQNFVGSPVNIQEPTGNPGEQEAIEEDSITLKNIKHNLFAGIQENPVPNAPVVGSPEPFKWKLEAAGEPFQYFPYVEIGDGRFYLGYSLLKISPPRAALGNKPERPWRFQFLE